MGLVGVVVRRYIDFHIFLIPTLVYICSFLQQHPYFLIKIFSVPVPVHFVIYLIFFSRSINHRYLSLKYLCINKH